MAIGDQLRRITGLARPTVTETAPAALVSRPMNAAAGYMRGGVSMFFNRWKPALRDPRDDVRQAWTMATARATDVIQNSGWIAGGVQQAVASMVGSGLRLSAKPDAAAIGWDDTTAASWSRMVERKFEAWCDSPLHCDMLGRQTVGQMCAAGVRGWFRSGEMVAVIPHHKRFGSPVGTKVRLVPTHRLKQTSDPLRNVFQGVRMDPTGLPVGYLFEFLDRMGIAQEREIIARDAWARPQVIHVYDGDAGQVRGITPMAPALQVVKQYDQLSNATLMAALVQSIFAATIESQSPTTDLLQALQDPTAQGIGGDLDAFLGARMGWHSNTQIDLHEHGKLAHLFPGESLKFNRSEHPNGNYESFANMLLREIARCLGLTFEQLTGNYNGATYSSMLMATAEAWKIVLYRRKHIAGRFMQMVYDAWLEEQIELGLIEFPGGIDNFLQQRAAATRAEWRGPPKPQADDLKAAKAMQINMSLGIMSADQAASDLGEDWEDTFEQMAREQQRREELGLPDPVYPGQAAPEVPDEETAKEPANA